MAQQHIVKDVAGQRITEADVISRLKLSGAWHTAVVELAQEAVVAQAARKEGVSASDSELQEEFDHFRADRELFKAEDTHGWLQSEGLTVEQVETCLEADILGSKLAGRLITDDEIERYYNENLRDFDYARISQIVVPKEGAAQELALSAREEGEDFARLARQHSIDETTRLGGGYLGLVTRDDTAGLPAETAERIFAASPGEIIGPFDLRDAWCVVRVEETGRWELDDDLREILRQQLFGDWLAEKAGGNGSLS